MEMKRKKKNSVVSCQARERIEALFFFFLIRTEYGM